MDVHSHGRTDKHEFVRPLWLKPKIQKAQTQAKQVIFPKYRWKIYWKVNKLNLLHEIILDRVLIHCGMDCQKQRVKMSEANDVFICHH